MTTRSKGNRIQRKAIAYYINKGWFVDKAEKTGRFIKYKDLFSNYCFECEAECDSDDHYKFDGFDLVCIRDGVTKYIQVKTNRPPSQQPYIDFAESFAGKYLKVESFTWYDHDGPRIQRYYKNGNIREFDYRKSRNEGEKTYDVSTD